MPTNNQFSNDEALLMLEKIVHEHYGAGAKSLMLLGHMLQPEACQELARNLMPDSCGYSYYSVQSTQTP